MLVLFGGNFMGSSQVYIFITADYFCAASLEFSYAVGCDCVILMFSLKLIGAPYEIETAEYCNAL